ncbi:NUDIX hydrolase domain-like protein [Fennellomyces sp. T-0311]|nr:NUDIX hydrolase domain-like protein [Fennellomyces sp. T-0311]
MQALRTLCQQLQQYRSLHIDSPPEQPRRACVAAILRCRPSQPVNAAPASTINEFLEQPWVQESEPELLFILRATRASDRWSGHVAFPGGKNEPNENDEETAVRETLEEIGLDLASPAFLPVGLLDAREVTNMQGKLMMVLVPHVYIQVVPDTPPMTIQESEVALAQWVPLRYFLSTEAYPDTPVRTSIMLGSVAFPAIDLPTDEKHQMRLWGMTLGMTSELIEFTTRRHDGRPAWQQQFVKMANQHPAFSQRDIGWLYRFFLWLQPAQRKQDTIKSFQKAIRRAISIAVVWRLAVGVAVLGSLGRKLLRYKRT